MVFRAVVAATLMLALVACGGGPADISGAPVRIAPDLALTLPEPGDLGRDLEASQLLTVRYGDRTFVFEGRLSATSKRFLMVGLDPLGRELLRIDWTQSGLDYQAAPWLPGGLRPENMLADIVLLYWPEATVRHILAMAGGTLVSGPHSRVILVGKTEVMRADYQPEDGIDPWTGRLHYWNLAWGYDLEIQTTEVRP